MKRWTSAQLLRAAEFVYATLALFALTQGPVYQLWKYSADQLVVLPSPSLPFIYFVTFIAAQIPAILLLARRARGAWFERRSSQSLIALLIWLTLGVFWSTFARHSLPEVVALAATTAFGVYLATSFTARQFWWVIASAMTLGVGSSWFAIMRLWDGAYNFIEGYWIGIYFNRNSLAPVAAMAIIAALGVVAAEWPAMRRKPVFWLAFVGTPAGLLIVFSAIELRGSESQTSPLALFAGVSAVALWLALRWVSTRVSWLHILHSVAASLTFLVLGVVLFVSLIAVGGFGGVSTEVATLNSRRAFWSLSWSAILEKPWLGWGWMAAWRSPEFYNYGLWIAEWDTVWSHNGYHDVLLGGGAVAGVLFVLYLWFASSEMHTRSLRSALPSVFVTAFVLSAATQESFFIGSHFLWALLVAALSGSWSESVSVD